MATLIEANQHRSKKEWEKARVIYDKLWENDNSQFSDWEIRHYDFDMACKLCELVIERSPKFSPIYSEYYWNKYYTVIKVYPDDSIPSEEKEKVANEIKKRFSSYPKYSPYLNTCLYMSEWYCERGEYEKTIEWLEPIDYKELSKTYKFTINNEEKYFTPQKAKYFDILSKAHQESEQIDEAIEVCYKGLIEYSNIQVLKIRLSELFKKNIN